MNKQIILNKKKSIINSIIIPILFCIIYILIYIFIPGIKVYIDENLGKQFFKGTFLFASAITLVLSMITFWGNEFFAEIRYKKNQMVLDKKKTEIISLSMPLIFVIVLNFIVLGIPFGFGTEKNIMFLEQIIMSAWASIHIAALSSIIIFWLIVLFSKEKIKDEK